MFHRTLIDALLEDPLDTSNNLITNTPHPTTPDATNNHTTPFTVSSSCFPTPPMYNCRIFEHLIPEIELHPCVAPEGFQWGTKWELFPVDVASSSTAANHQQTKALKNCSLIW